MKKQETKQQGMENINPLKSLAGKIASNLEGVNLAIQDLRRETSFNTRLGVTIDWSTGTMILESDRK